MKVESSPIDSKEPKSLTARMGLAKLQSLREADEHEMPFTQACIPPRPATQITHD